TNDDAIATVPAVYPGGVPPVTFVTDPNSPTDFAPIHLLRGSTSLEMGFGKVPMTAFSDGTRVLALFAPLEPALCDSSPSAPGTCPSEPNFVCSDKLGECQPLYTTIKQMCDLNTQAGCYPTQQCVATSAAVCVDEGSSQYDGTSIGQFLSIVSSSI